MGMQGGVLRDEGVERRLVFLREHDWFGHPTQSSEARREDEEASIVRVGVRVGGDAAVGSHELWEERCRAEGNHAQPPWGLSVLEPLHESRHALDERARPREAARVGWACGPRYRLAGERRGLGRGGFPNGAARSIEVAPGSVVDLAPRHAAGERLGGLELRCDHHRAGRIDIPVLAVDRERSQSLGEPLCPIRLRKPHHYFSPAVDVTPQHPRRLRGPLCDCRSAIGEAPDAVELRGNHDASGRVDEAPLLAHLDSSQALRKIAWIARIARRDYHNAFGVDKTPFLSYLDAAATLTEKRG